MMPYMTTHSVTSFDHDAIYDNDSILGLVPNLLITFCLSNLHMKYCNYMLHCSVIESMLTLTLGLKKI